MVSLKVREGFEKGFGPPPTMSSMDLGTKAHPNPVASPIIRIIRITRIWEQRLIQTQSHRLLRAPGLELGLGLELGRGLELGLGLGLGLGSHRVTDG